MIRRVLQDQRHHALTHPTRVSHTPGRLCILHSGRSLHQTRGWFTVTLQLSTRTVAWLADRPRPRELVGSVWDTLTDLERAGHHPRAIAALRFVLVHSPPPPPADALTAASPGAACGAADPGRAWSGGKSTTSCSAHSPPAPTTGNDRKDRRQGCLTPSATPPATPPPILSSQRPGTQTARRLCQTGGHQ
jgi:hypothetical protein